MHNFGKLTMRPKTFEFKDDAGNVIDSKTVMAFYDVNDVLWHDLYPQFEHDFYIAVNDDGVISSFERDAEQSQIAGFDIIGINADEISADSSVIPGSEGGAITGHLWDGSIMSKRPPTRDELFPPLAKWRFEAMIDIYGNANGIDLRGMIDAAVEALPEPNKTVVKSKRQNVIEFIRTDPLFDFIGSSGDIGMTPEQIDVLWLAGLDL
jgi:hypothetical protein